MSPSTYPVTGKTVLITGAARGIGADTAKRLAARGAKLSLVGLEPEELEKVAAACGDDAVWFETDVTVRDELDSAVAQTLERFGGIDVVMANAGIASGGFVETMDPDAWERIIHVNLIGVYRTVHATLPHVIQRKGYVLPVASLAAFIHGPLMSAYCATKAGVEAFADSLRTEVAHEGVDVGCAYFSWIGTDMVHGGDELPAFAEMRAKLRGPFGKTYPVSAAGEAVVKGIETRARIVAAPSWVGRISGIRRLAQRLAERESLKQIPLMKDLLERDLASRGEDAHRPVGAGGAADARSRERHGSAV